MIPVGIYKSAISKYRQRLHALEFVRQLTPLVVKVQLDKTFFDVDDEQIKQVSSILQSAIDEMLDDTEVSLYEVKKLMELEKNNE